MREVVAFALRHEAAQETRTRRQAFAAATSVLRAGGNEMPELDARLLLCHAAKLTQETYVAASDRPLNEEAASRFDAMIARRSRLGHRDDGFIERGQRGAVADAAPKLRLFQ